jgi:uncharacterized protein YkwD
VPATNTEPPVEESVAEAVPAEPDESEFVTPVEEPATDTEPPEPEPTVEPEVPAADEPPDQLEEGCLDAVAVADVTIPDGTIVNAGEIFNKIWRLRNTGTCDWTDALGEFKWVFTSGAQMNGPSQLPIVGPVPSGSEYDVEVELTAPEEPGLHEGRWRVLGPNAEPVGVLFWVLIDVPGEEPADESGDAPPAPKPAEPPSSDATGLSQQVWEHINGERDRYGLYQLAYNEKLALAAQRHAEDCSQRGSCSHDGSDGSDEQTRVRRVGYQGSVDESWAWSASPMDAVAWWLDEVPPNDWHRRMLLSDLWREIGVGVAPADFGYYFIAVFGRPGQ